MGDQFTDLLSDYIDDEDVSSGERARIERHLQGCADCRATVSELRRVAEYGRALPDSAPVRDLWPGVAARIGPAARTGVQGGSPTQALRRRISFTLPQLAAAALALMVLSGGTVWLARVGSPGTDFEPLSAQGEAVSNLPAATGRREGEADLGVGAELDQALGTARARLDPDTLDVLQSGLTAANRAIADCQRALAADPSNPDLNTCLASAQRMKLLLLQHAGDLAVVRP